MKKILLLSVLFVVIIMYSGGTAIAGKQDIQEPDVISDESSRKNSGSYIGARIGLSSVKLRSHKIDNGQSVRFADTSSSVGNLGVFAGYLLGDLRTDIELTFRGREAMKSNENGKNLNLKAAPITVMWNIWYDIHLSPEFTPYLGAGIGASSSLLRYNLDGARNKQKLSKARPAAGVGTGIRYRLNESVELDLGYRYIYTSLVSRIEPTAKLNSKAHIHDIMFGICYTR